MHKFKYGGKLRFIVGEGEMVVVDSKSITFAFGFEPASFESPWE